MTTRTAVICEPVRTPIGRYGGMFKSLTAVDLGVTALKGLLERTGIAPDAVQDVILGHCYPNSEAPAIGRVVALDAGLPITVPVCRSTVAAAPVCRPSSRRACRWPAATTIWWSRAAPRA